jgi:arylformamidase
MELEFSDGFKHTKFMIYDISPTLSESSACWPQRPGFKKTALTDMHQGSVCNTFTMSMPTLFGAVAVAPSHTGFKVKTIDECELDAFIGPCQVIHVEVQHSGLIREPMLSVDIRSERVLFATNTFKYDAAFHKEFAALDVSLIDELGKRGVVLVGIDTPSIDLFQSTTLSAHRRAYEYGMAVLEGLNLADVPNGLYELIALPLKLKGLDASPVRAVLRAL